MLSENDKQNLLRNLARNRVVLVTGAGFSADAVNISGSFLPVGTQLARQLETATAHLLLKKSLAAANASAAAPLKEEAVRILRLHMADPQHVSIHALHIFGRQMLNYVWRCVPTLERSQRFQETYDELRRSIPEHLRTHPELVRVLDDLKRAELETVVRPA